LHGVIIVHLPAIINATATVNSKYSQSCIWRH